MVSSNCLLPHGLYNPWNSPGQNTGVGRHSLFQGIFPIQGSNPGLLHCSSPGPHVPAPPRPAAHLSGLSQRCSAWRNQRTQACMLLVVCAPSRYQVRGPRRSNCVRPGHSVCRSPGVGEQGSPPGAAPSQPSHILPLRSSTNCLPVPRALVTRQSDRPRSLWLGPSRWD